MNAHEVRVSDLARQRDVADQTYRTYLTDMEQARIDEELQTGQISNIGVIQDASYVARPVKPRRSLILVMAFVVASLGAAGAVLIREALDNSLRSPQDVEQSLELPVLAALS